MARQPIYDRQLNLSGYELLYRGGAQAMVGEVDESLEMAAIANILVEVGLDKLAGDKVAFINVPSRLLNAEALRLFPPDRVVLEILEDTPWNEDVASQIATLRSLRYKLALDDYVFEPRHAPFLPLVQIVKVDVLGMDEATLRQQMSGIRREGQIFLAEKVENHEMVELCMKLGFDLFQGYFFAKPNTIKGTGIPANYAMSISLLAKLQDPDISLDELDSLIVGNVALCHKVLRLVNSAALGLSRSIESIRQALIFVGTGRIRSLASLALMTSIPGKTPELYSLAMVRARFCEEWAKMHGADCPEKHFTVGLLSILDALMDTPMNDVLAELPLSAEVSDALCGKSPESSCSRALNEILTIERGGWDQGIYEGHSYLDALAWAREQECAMAA